MQAIGNRMGGLRAQPLERLKQALREGHVRGATAALAERHGLHGGDVVRNTRQRQALESRMERQDAQVREWDRQRAVARATGTPVTVTPAHRAAARRHAPAAVSRRSIPSGGGHYVDAHGVRRNEYGAPLPNSLQPTSDERKRLAIERARKRMTAGNGR
jgi:hypothetical protein